MFLQVSVILSTGEGVWLPGGGYAWLLGGVHGCWGACLVVGGHAWLQGDMCGCQGACEVVGGGMHGCWGACVVAGGVHGCWGACMVAGGMHGCQGVCMVARGVWLLGGMCRIRRDTVNERAVRILLECILVENIFQWPLIGHHDDKLCWKCLSLKCSVCFTVKLIITDILAQENSILWNSSPSKS